MAASERWYFSKEILANTPSRKSGIDGDKELSYRQQAANFIQDMGQRLQVAQLCINTAIVYMHRFYMFHSFIKFHRNAISTCSLFLAAKVEEQPRKLEHVIKVAHLCLHRDGPPLDSKSEAYLEQVQELVINENIMLQTLGFDIAIEHPHTYVVKCCQLVRASKDLAQTSYFLATNSLHLTTMCLQYKPTAVACVCIHLACKWSNWELQCSSEGKEWFWYVDKSVTLELLEELTSEFLAILDKCPSRLKRKIMSGGGSVKDNQAADKRKADQSIPEAFNPNSVGGAVLDEKDIIDSQPENWLNDKTPSPINDESELTLSLVPVTAASSNSDQHPLPNVPLVQEPSSPSLKQIKNEGSHSISLATYREKKKEKERLAVQQKLRTSKEKHSSHSSSIGASNNSDQKVDVTKSAHSSVHEKVKHKIHSRLTGGSNLHVNEERHNKLNTSSPYKEISSNVKRVQLSPNLVLEDIPDVDTRNLQCSSSVEGKQLNSAYVLLTRLEMPQNKSKDNKSKRLEEKDNRETVMGNHARGTHRSNLFDSHIKPKNENSRSSSEIHSKPSAPEAAVSVNKLPKIKHQRQKAVASSLPTEDRDVTPKDNFLNKSPPWDSSKANGSQSSEHVSVDLKPLEFLENAIMKSNELIKNMEHSKHERRDKHRHKHSGHSSDKEKPTVSRSDDQPPNAVMTGGLKITIPKDILILSNVRQDQSHYQSSSNNSSSPKKEGGLKIKIPKIKIAAPDASKNVVNTNSSSSLKLVITKDRYNAGSYSTSQKSDRELRKRERSPKESSHDQRTLDSSPVSKSPRLIKMHANKKGHSYNQGGSSANVPTHPETGLSKHHLHGDSNQQHDATPKQLNSGLMHQQHHAENAPVQPPFMVPPHYGPPPPQYYPFYAYPHGPPRMVHHPMTAGGYPPQPLPNIFNQPPPPPPILPHNPPLPREPPPPLPREPPPRPPPPPE